MSDLPILHEKPPTNNYAGTDELIVTTCEGVLWLARVYIELSTSETIIAKVPFVHTRKEVTE